MTPVEQVKIANNVGKAETAMQQADLKWLAGWLYGRFGIELDEQWLVETIARANPVQMWSDNSWAMWWRNRLDEAGLIEAPGKTSADTPSLHVTLHVDGTWYASPEELARLRQFADAVGHYGPSTPAIARTQTKPTPIDSTAARVVGMNPSKETQ